MTLANFKSNFNWQLRALQQLTDCCGVVPDIPPNPPVPPAQECIYVGFINLNGGGGLSDYTLTDNVTPLINAYGEGYLRTLMQSQQGDVYAPFYDPTNFILNGIHLYYVGTSANNIDVNFFGGYFGTINFTRLSDLSIQCQPVSCYTLTFPTAYYQLVDISFSFAPLQILSSNLISSAPFYNYINVTNVVDMTTLINQIYGSSAVYAIVDNGNDTYTITITNAYYFGSNPILSLANSRFEYYTDTMIDC
jgi:hypothetical protein